MFYCENTFPVPQRFQEGYSANKRLDTWAHPKHHCRGTIAPDKMDMHFYVYASLNSLLDLCLLYLPTRCPS